MPPPSDDPTPTPGDATIHSLREAIGVSPDNVPLRRHLAETLRSYARLDEAISEYRQAIELAKGDPSLKLGLAETYLQQGHASRAIVVLEELVNGPGATAPASLALAKALLSEGQHDRATHHYREAVAMDPALQDDELDHRLGVSTRAPFEDEDADADDHDHESRRLRATSSGMVDEDDLEDEARRAGVDLERPELSFRDVGGMEVIKEEIRLKIIYPLQHPELYASYGKRAGGGILMYGPPGCGKTYLARATAGEVNARFLAIGIADVLNMYIGQSERQLHELFEVARSSAPCVLFFDEVDALGASRSDMRQSAGRHLVNQFLNELDGVEASNDGLLILAATNAPWHVDSAFRRPGRFDRILFVPPPDREARLEIVRLMLKGKPSDAVDVEAIAKKTEGFSGADLRAMVESSIEDKLRVALKSGTTQPLRTKDLLAAAKRVRPSTKDWFATAKNHALYANQGGLYDDVLDYMKLR